MEHHDLVVVGGGMAGLSAAAFASLCGRSVAVLEKNDKAGGLASSFRLDGVGFDIGIEGLRELAPDSYLRPFLRWWGIDLPLEARTETMDIYTRRSRYRIRGESARDDMRAAFPGSARDIDRFFSLNSKIVAEMTAGATAPKPPYEMSPAEKLAFGFSSLMKRPHLLRYGLRDTSRVLPSLLRDPELLRVASSRTVDDMVYLAVAHRWEGVTSGKTMYPKGGIGAFPQAIAKSIESRGGKVHLRAEVTAIRQRDGGYSIECADGRSFEARSVVVAAPMPWAVHSLFGKDARFDALRGALRARKAFPGCFMSFVALDPAFDLGGANYIFDWGDEGSEPGIWAARRAGLELDPATAPIACTVAGTGKRGDGPIAMTVMSTLGWDYASRWGTETGPSGSIDCGGSCAPRDYRRSEVYRRTKLAAEATILDRLAGRLGPKFREAILFSSASTPLSFARHTNNPGGSYMGFSIRAGEYGRFFRQQSPLPGLLFAGQWVFPGFGVAGAAASGYYAAKALLAREGSDLDARLRELE